MDPYIEVCDLWEDFHEDLIAEIKRYLAGVVPERYAVRTGERSYVVLMGSKGEREHRLQTDVGVALSSAGGMVPPKTGGAAVAEPATETAPVAMRAVVETEYREAFIEIRELHPERRLVTCLEVLSPSNKRRRSPGRRQYLRKRQAFLLGSANLVELDLLRGGQRLPMVDAWPDSPYTLLVAREEKAPDCLVWPAHFLRPLPVIPVPLATPDPDVPLALQPMIEAIYARSRYDRDIDYTRPLRPPLGPAETAWLEERLRERQASP
jgi:hypothetical protein